MNLPNAMKKVLLTEPPEGMHSVDITKEIIVRELYLKKDGSFIDEKQDKSYANNSKDIFTCLPGNMIKLKVEGLTVIDRIKGY